MPWNTWLSIHCGIGAIFPASSVMAAPDDVRRVVSAEPESR